ncbi:uncharacterized protein VTP21DRAFT_8364 [Calcarisporiella thermophila]|uniref:uncharacterized protein n=1 Tax=Calcarisporiella thermophila TaxID=911321 RepID=UPI003743DF20
MSDGKREEDRREEDSQITSKSDSEGSIIVAADDSIDKPKSDEEDKESEEISEEEDASDGEYEEDEEPKFKYQRLMGNGLQELLKKDAASVLTVTDRFLALGTHWGTVSILDFEGDEIKKFACHSATVNDLSIDAAGEYVASASVDGKVVINALYSDELATFNFRRPMKSVALDPDYRTTKQFVCGGMSEQLIMNEKSWLGQTKGRVLHSGEGPIYAIEWRKHFIAWANDLGVKIFDTRSNQRITYIDRAPDSPRPDLYRCHLKWRDDSTLLIGWASHVKVAVIKETPKGMQAQGMPSHYAEIVMMFQTDFIICGLAPFNDMLVVLAYVIEEEESTDIDPHGRRPAQRPELRIINKDNEEISSDALSVHNYALYQANDYLLNFVSSEDMFYVLSPKDVVVVRPCDLDDHITWLLDKEEYEEALVALQDAHVTGGSKRFTVKEIGQKYLEWLIENGEFDKAAEVCSKVLGSDKQLWEQWIFTFGEMKQLKAIAPYIPIENPQLTSTVYEMVLAFFLNHDHQALYNTIENWPASLYNLDSVIVAVRDVLARDRNNKLLMQSLAELYTLSNQLDKALEYNLRLRRPQSFDLIRKYNMYPAIRDKAMLLMDFDAYVFEAEESPNEDGVTDERPKRREIDMPAVQLLVQNTDAIPPKRVVEQLRNNSRYLHTYLDALFERDPHLGLEFHDEQVELYAEYDYTKLLPFLRRSNFYNLEKAYLVCETRDLVPEMVFLLGRMGNNKKALGLIIERLGDVQRAIDFAKEQNDEDLWEDLVRYSLDKPLFIKGLLLSVGTEIDRIQLIRRIPDGLEIPDLIDTLTKVLQDYNLQVSLRKDCERILVSDSVTLANRLHKYQRRGFAVNVEDMKCETCQDYLNTSMTDSRPIIKFFCQHIYHESCLLEDTSRHTFPEHQPSRAIFSHANKINHATMVRTRRRLRCPLCDAQDQAQGKKPLDKPGPTRSLVSPSIGTRKPESFMSASSRGSGAGSATREDAYSSRISLNFTR